MTLPLSAAETPRFLVHQTVCPGHHSASAGPSPRLQTRRQDTRRCLSDRRSHFLGHRNGRTPRCRGSGSRLAAALTPDCGVAALAEYQSVRLWNTENASNRRTDRCFRRHQHPCTDDDGSLLATGGDTHLVELWNTRTGDRLHTLRGHDAYLGAAAFASSGELLATGAHDRTIRLWDPVAGKQVRLLEAIPIRCPHCFSCRTARRSSHRVGTRLSLWDAATGKEKNGSRKISLACDGSWSWKRRQKSWRRRSLDGAARIWNVATGKRR